MENKFTFRGWFVVECAQRGYNDFSRSAQFVWEADAVAWMEAQQAIYTDTVFKMHFEPSLEYLKQRDYVFQKSLEITERYAGNDVEEPEDWREEYERWREETESHLCKGEPTEEINSEDKE